MFAFAAIVRCWRRGAFSSYLFITLKIQFQFQRPKGNRFCIWRRSFSHDKWIYLVYMRNALCKCDFVDHAVRLGEKQLVECERARLSTVRIENAVDCFNCRESFTLNCVVHVVNWQVKEEKCISKRARRKKNPNQIIESNYVFAILRSASMPIDPFLLELFLLRNGVGNVFVIFFFAGWSS